MIQIRLPKTWMYLLVTVVILIGGCDERATRIAMEAADRQAQQNTAMAELNKEVASGTRHLVDSDAKARQEMLAVHRDLQDERARLNTSWNALEEERREIMTQRRTKSMLASMTTLLGSLLLVGLLLGFCWHALVAASRSGAEDAQLSHLLIHELLADEPPLIERHRPTLAAPVEQEIGQHA